MLPFSIRANTLPLLAILTSATIAAACAGAAGGAAPQPASEASSEAPRWTVQPSGTTASLRGLSVVDARVAWASGSGGTFVRTTDGGATWRADTVPGATALDFRDVQAFDANTALLLSAGEPARMYRTTDGGRTWRVTHADDTPGIFFDGMAFWDGRNGIAFSDPVGGSWVVITTSDGGQTWSRVPASALPAPLPGEAAVAASGRAIAVAAPGDAWIGTGGGASARVLRTRDRGRTWEASAVPIPSGNNSSGIFSVALLPDGRGIAVGGDYRQERAESPTVAVTADRGRTWTLAGPSRPAGVREAVLHVPGTRGPTVVSVGPSGTGFSTDGGRSWMPLADTLGFHTADFVDARTGWAVGGNGRIARFRGSVPGALPR